MKMVSYVGDLSPLESWKIMENDKSAELVDVRTSAEWCFVGIPDLSSISKKLIQIEWQEFPTMEVNGDFMTILSKKIPNKDKPIFFLCRSGGRSAMAADLATQCGYKQCYNIKEGFEGALDSNKHRSNVSGWKFHQLPWEQS
jgi:rhodanese-related sulfurtransferase